MVYLLDVEGVMIFLKKNSEPHKWEICQKKMTTKPQPKEIQNQALSCEDSAWLLCPFQIRKDLPLYQNRLWSNLTAGRPVRVGPYAQGRWPCIFCIR